MIIGFTPGRRRHRSNSGPQHHSILLKNLWVRLPEGAKYRLLDRWEGLYADGGDTPKLKGPLQKGAAPVRVARWSRQVILHFAFFLPVPHDWASLQRVPAVLSAWM